MRILLVVILMLGPLLSSYAAEQAPLSLQREDPIGIGGAVAPLDAKFYDNTGQPLQQFSPGEVIIAAIKPSAGETADEAIERLWVITSDGTMLKIANRQAKIHDNETWITVPTAIAHSGLPPLKAGSHLFLIQYLEAQQAVRVGMCYVAGAATRQPIQEDNYEMLLQVLDALTFCGQYERKTVLWTKEDDPARKYDNRLRQVIGSLLDQLKTQPQAGACRPMLLLLQAKYSRLQGDYDGADGLLHELIRGFPKDRTIPEAMYLLGMNYLDLKNISKAYGTLQLMQMQYPSHRLTIDLCCSAIYECDMNGQKEIGGKLEQYLNDLLARHPQTYDFALYIANVLYDEKAYQQSAGYYQVCCQKSIDYRDKELLLYRYATALYKSGLAGNKENFNKAIASYLDFYTKYALSELQDDALYWAANAYERVGNYTEALRLLDTIISTFGNSDMLVYAKRMSDRLITLTGTAGQPSPSVTSPNKQQDEWREIPFVMYDSMSQVRDGYAICRQNQRFGLLDLHGSRIARPEDAKYDEVEFFSGNRALVRRNGKYGYLDKSLQIAIPFQYDEAAAFSEGYAAIAIGNKYGYINGNDDLLVPCTYDSASAVIDGIAIVSQDGKFSLLSLQKKTIVSGQYDNIRPASAGLYQVQNGKQWGYIDKNGTEVISPRFAEAGPFADGVAPIQSEGKWGVVDVSGRMIVKPAYAFIGPFNEGIARMKSNNKWGYLRKDGTVLCAPIYDDAMDFTGGSARVARGKKWGFINAAAEVTCAFDYDAIRKPSGGFAAAMQNGKWMFINAYGYSPAQKKYDAVSDMHDGVIVVKLSDTWQYLDASGKVLRELKCDVAEPFSDGYALIKEHTDQGTVWTYLYCE